MINLEKDKKHIKNPFFEAAEDFLICLGITFTASVFSYEAYMPVRFMSIFLTFITVVCILFWIWSLIKNGYRKRLLFIILTGIFWMLPLILTFLTEKGPEFIRLSTIILLWNDYSQLTVSRITSIWSGFFNVSQNITLISVCLLSLFIYFCGFFIRKNRLGIKR